VDTYTITFTDGSITTFTVNNGEKGDQGEQGIQGEKGDQGEQGIQGEKGDQGIQGEAGLSAFEIYLKYHPEFTGTEEDWVNGLTGQGTAPETGEFVFAVNTDGVSYILVSYTGIDRFVAVPTSHAGYPVSVIGANAFADNGTIEHISLPETVIVIEDSAFKGCSALKEVIIPKNVTSIGKGLFYGCSSMSSIKVDAENHTYHSENNCIIETATNTLVAGCKTSEIPTDGSVTIIGDSAFSGCSQLSGINIPDGIIRIETRAFEGCRGLTSVIIPEGVISIGSYAFFNCTELKIITVPNSVTFMGSYCLARCSSLTTMYFSGTVEEMKAVVKVMSWKENSMKFTSIVCDDGTLHPANA
jgi:hypothetical protein